MFPGQALGPWVRLVIHTTSLDSFVNEILDISSDGCCQSVSVIYNKKKTPKESFYIARYHLAGSQSALQGNPDHQQHLTH